MGSWVIEVGRKVFYKNREAMVDAIPDLVLVQIRYSETGQLALVPRVELMHAPLDETPGTVAFENISDADWAEAGKKELELKPLLRSRTTAMVEKVAAEIGVHRSTVYRRLERYEPTMDKSSLLSRQPSGGLGKGRLPERIEDYIKESVPKKYLTNQKLKIEELVKKIWNGCKKITDRPPCKNTIRNRIEWLRSAERMKRGEGPKGESLEPIKGKFPGADFPLAIVQGDHTKVDIVVVDEEYREPVGRPWITIFFDIFSRMILGFYLSLDPPGTIGTALALSHAILPKENWLAKIGVEGSWPASGKMQSIHLDNAGEFRGKTLKKGCHDNDINIIWRPVKRAHYGGHIERYMRTIMEFIHNLPGTTFSNVTDKGDYDSEKEAVLTLASLEEIITRFIVNIYHQEKHAGLGMSPLQKFEQGILGDGKRPGIGLPPMITDELKLRLDFMPYEERTVQRYGIVWDGIHYYHNVLRRWIGSRDPKDKKKMRQFIVRRDPRDISKIYFYDPELGRYFGIPYRDITRKPMSLWEVRYVKGRLKDRGIENPEEREIFEEHERIMSIVDRDARTKKSARRMAQRRKDHKDVLPEIPQGEVLDDGYQGDGDNLTKIKPFEEDD